MMGNIVHIALVVKDYDEAIDFYTNKLGFVLVEDTDMGDGKRWVRIAPSKDASFSLLLAKAKDEHQLNYAGDQTGGRVFLFWHVEDFWQTYEFLKKNSVKFCEEPRDEIYATVVVFEDLYGNKWDLIQPKSN